MAKDNSEANSINNNLSTPSSSGIRRNARSKPYDANNSFVKKVATKVTDLIPQPSWISRWFNSSQDEAGLQTMETDNPQYEAFEEKQSQPPPLKRPCIRMDVTHPPGTFAIKPSNRGKGAVPGGDADSLKPHFSNHNETTQDFLEPSVSGRMPRFVASTPAFPVATSSKVSDTRPTLNLLISEQNNAAANGVDDNSETSESTSGCSSLIPQNNRQEASNANFNSSFTSKRRYIDNKLDLTNHLQSPRSLFLDSSTRETLSSRRPSFNPMMVTNTLDRSASLQSPFYPGNTMFGGSNAASLYRAGSILSEASRYQTAPKRASVQVNPSSESTSCDTSSMSHTARRILETLEQFSSPLTDAKKMPVHNISGGSTFNISNNTTLNSSTLNRKRAREDETSSPRVGLRHLTRQLTVPTVPDLLRIRRKQKLQKTTVNARKIMSARTAPATVTTQEYHIRMEDETEPKRKAPLKAKKKTNLEEQETVEAVNLPTIALPISNLPRFDISLPQCPKPNISSDKQTQQQSKQQAEKNSAFKFASPIKLTDGAKNLESINNFTFSKPMSPSKLNFAEINDTYELSRTLSVRSDDTLSSQPSYPNFIWAGPSQTLKPKEKEHQPKAPPVASELKSGSVMDFFAKQSATTSNVDQSNVWECNECLIKNSGKETHCVACKNSKHDSSDDIEILECPSEDTNSLEENKIIKTSTKVPSSLRPNTNSPLSKLNSSSQTLIVNKSKSSESTINTSSKLFSSTANESLNSSNTPQLNVFKPAKASWECPCCMVRNTDTVSTCPCCNTAKPGSINVSPKRKIDKSAPPATTTTSGFGDKFKKPEGSWSCDTCMVQNKSDANKCVACETSRPGLAKTNLSSTSSSASLSSGFGDKFKKPEGSWSCDTCMVQNKSDVSKCVACETPRAGANTDSAPSKSSSKLQFNVDMPANAGSFKFGIDKAESSTNLSSATPKTNGFTFGAPTTSSQSTSGGFSFGVPSDANKKKESETSAAPAFGFKSDTVAATATFQFGVKPTDTKDKEEKVPASTAVFQFGTGATDAKDKKDTNPPITATFSFGSPSKPDATNIPSAGFVFGAAAATTTENTDVKKSDATPTGGLFIFGAQTAATTQTTKDSTADKTTKSTTGVTTNNFIFGSPKPASDVSKVEDKISTAVETVPKFEPPKSTSLFSTPTEQSKPIAPTFSFGSSATSATIAPSLSTTSASLFTFGAQAKASDSAVSNTTTSLPAFGSAGAPKPTFSFGKPAEPTGVAANQQENKPPSMFGNVAASPSFGGQTNQATPSLFGSSVSTTNANDSKPLMFVGAEKKNASSFGEPDNKIPAFGSTTNKTETSGFGTASPVPSAFGASATATSATASPFGATPSLFGNSAAPSFSTTTPTSNIFSATTKPPETTSSSSGLFTFGQSSQASAPTTGGFSFSAGSNATANVDQQKGIFSFGASSNNPQQQVGNGFNTSTFSGASATPASSFTFNAPPKPDTSSATSLFGQAAAPSTTPMFNAPSNTTGQPTGLPPAYPGTTSSTPATSSGFNFGSTNVPNSFNFGSPPAPSAGGYNFNAPSTPAAAPAFDPNAQPTFNFTAGSAPTAFNAPPTRKIKKAVRRMPRQ